MTPYSDARAAARSYKPAACAREFTIFGLGTGAVFAGFLELMMRERLPRPTLVRWMPTSGSSNGN